MTRSSLCLIAAIAISASTAAFSSSTIQSISAASVTSYSDASCSQQTNTASNVAADGSCTQLSGFSGQLKCQSVGSASPITINAFLDSTCSGTPIVSKSGTSGSCTALTVGGLSQYVKVDCATSSGLVVNTPTVGADPTASSDEPAQTPTIVPELGTQQVDLPTGSAINVPNNGDQVGSDTSVGANTNANTASSDGGGVAFNPAGEGTTAGNDVFATTNPNAQAGLTGNININPNAAVADDSNSAVQSQTTGASFVVFVLAAVAAFVAL